MQLGSFGLLTIAHAFLALLLIIELGITGWIVGEFDDGWWRSPSQFSFLLFCTIWSVLVLLYVAITPVLIPKLFRTIIAFPLLALTALFWFAGAIAAAVLIGVPDCNGARFCQTAQAGVAFAFFLWVGFTALAVLEGLAFWRSRGHGAHADTRSKTSGYPGV